MSWKKRAQFWKDKGTRAIETFELGESHFNQNKFSDASNLFLQAAKFAEESSDNSLSQKAEAMSKLSGALKSNDPSLWRETGYSFDRVNENVVHVPNPINTETVKKLCLLYSEILSVDLHTETLSNVEKIESVAKKCLQLGNEQLFYRMLEDQKQMTAFEQGNFLAGRAEEIKGNMLEIVDPSKASEHFSAAITRYNLSNLAGRISDVESRLKLIQTTGKCWFCGREGFGLETNFVLMKSKITPYLHNLNTNDGYSSTVSDSEIIVCTSCYHSINWEVERVSTKYYQMTQNLINQLSNQIDSLWRAIRDLQSESHTHY